MSRVLKKIVIVLFLVFSFKPLALAIDCTYPEADLIITYDENGVNDEYIRSKFIKSKYYLNTFIFGTSNSSNETREIEIDQSLWKKYKGVACPSGMKVCTTTTYSLDAPTLKGLGAGIVDGFINNLLVAPHVSDDVKNWTGENTYNLLNFDARKLYVLTKEEYDNSDISRYHNGINITNTFKENAEIGYYGCKGDGEEWYNYLAGAVCGFFTDVGVSVYDLFAGEISIVKVIDVQCQDVRYRGPYMSFNVNCGQLMNKEVQYMDKINHYKECRDNQTCKSNAIKDINEVEENIKSQCKSILQNFDYEGVQQECIEDCLSMKDILNGYKKGTDLYDDGLSLGQCGFSDRLLIWIANIVRWVKYIVPVLVIVLGILDFIKAIASDKDDEMKKAQGRFVKRLIAAALIFIVPFIIEFILDKMGFTVTGCGVINL